MARPTGLAPWNPNPETQALIGQVLQVLDEYRDYLPMTGRQIFYRLVGAHGYTKTEKDYSNLLEKLVRARRCGLVPWDAIRDDGVTSEGGGGWRSYESFVASVKHWADEFALNIQQDQPAVIELWCEAEGMVPQMIQASEPWHVTVWSAGGFNSVTMKHDAALRIIERYQESNQTTILLHVGDHDPSGVSIFENLERDLGDFIRDYEEDPEILVCRRIAVTLEQAEAFQMDSAPPKRTDSRTANWEGETYQVEAMTPAQLAQVVRDAIEADIDPEALEDTQERSETEQARLVEHVAGF